MKADDAEADQDDRIDYENLLQTTTGQTPIFKTGSFDSVTQAETPDNHSHASYLTRANFPGSVDGLYNGNNSGEDNSLSYENNDIDDALRYSQQSGLPFGGEGKDSVFSTTQGNANNVEPYPDEPPPLPGSPPPLPTVPPPVLQSPLSEDAPLFPRVPPRRDLIRAGSMGETTENENKPQVLTPPIKININMADFDLQKSNLTPPVSPGSGIKFGSRLRDSYYMYKEDKTQILTDDTPMYTSGYADHNNGAGYASSSSSGLPGGFKANGTLTRPYSYGEEMHGNDEDDNLYDTPPPGHDY